MSPSVMMPASIPSPSTTPTQPKRFWLISARVASIRAPTAASGIASPTCMRSRTRVRLAPSEPPGWNFRKSSAVKPRRSSKAIASASPSASCTSDEVVGASPCGQASSILGRISATSAARASVESPREVTAMSGRRKRREYSTMLRSSGVSPDHESAMTASSPPIMPRSPWLASAGWMKKDGVPVEARVAAILAPTCPLLPMPVTMTRPCVSAIAVQACAKEAAISPARAASSARRPAISRRIVRWAESLGATSVFETARDGGMGCPLRLP